MGSQQSAATEGTVVPPRARSPSATPAANTTDLLAACQSCAVGLLAAGPPTWVQKEEKKKVEKRKKEVGNEDDNNLLMLLPLPFPWPAITVAGHVASLAGIRERKKVERTYVRESEGC